MADFIPSRARLSWRRYSHPRYLGKSVGQKSCEAQMILLNLI